MAKAKKLFGRVSARMVQEVGFALGLTRVPGLRRQQEKTIKNIYHLSNEIRRATGLEPKMFRMIKKRAIVEEFMP